MPLLDHFLRGGQVAPYNLVNHTPDAGGTWSIGSGVNFIISPDDFVRLATSSGVSVSLWSGDPGADDYEVAVLGRWRTFVLNSTLAAVSRCANIASNGVLGRCYCNDTAGSMTVNLQNAFPAYTVISSIVVPSGRFIAARDYYLVLKAVGTTFSLAVQDTVTGLWLDPGPNTFSSASRVDAVTGTSTVSSARGKIGIQDFPSASDTTGSSFAAIAYGAPDSNPQFTSSATAVTLTGPTTGLLNSASTDFTVGANGAITGTLTVTPSDGGAGGTFTPTSISLTSGSPTGTFTYTALSAGTKIISVTNNQALTDPSTISYLPQATATTLSGPATSTVGVPSSPFTAGANAAITGTVIITPSDGGAGGTFTPTTVSINTGSPTGTFTYTAGSAGVKTISTTNNGSLTNPTSLTVTASSLPATETTLSGPSSGVLGSTSTNFTVGANGVITGTVIITPSDGGAGGTFTPTTVSINAGSPTGTFTYTPSSAGAKTISTTNNGSLTNPTTITYTVTGASSISLSGPSSGQINVASTNFTVALNQVGVIGTVTVTPSDGGAGGTFTPTTVSLSNGTTSATFTYTPVSVGAKTISITNSGALTNGTPLTYTGLVVQTFYCDNSNIIKSPTNWNMIGSVGSQAAETVWPGSYMRFNINGTDLTINVDTSGLSEYPNVSIQIDAGQPVVTLLTAGQTTIVKSSLGAGTHEVNIIYLAKQNYSTANTWADAQKLKITSFVVSGGLGLQAPPAVHPKKAIIYGDSITAGLAITGSQPPAITVTSGVVAATASYGNFIGQGLDAEFDQCGCGADGWTANGVGGFPNLPSSWNFKKSGVARDISEHDYIVTLHGYNDGSVANSVVKNWLTAVRGSNANAWIFLCVPFSGRCRAGITGGVADYITAHPTETKIKVIDLGTTSFAGQTSGYFTTDGIHPNQWQMGRLASAYLGLIWRNILASNSGTPVTRVSFSLS